MNQHNSYWESVNGAIAYSLLKSSDKAAKLFERAITIRHRDSVDQVQQERDEAEVLLDLSKNSAAFEQEIRERIKFRRAALGLPDVEIRFS